VWKGFSEYVNSSVDSKCLKVVIASYTAILVTAMRRRYYEQAWGFLSELNRFLHSISKDEDEVLDIIRRCLANDIKMVRVYELKD
jgi:hypothetical protein